MCRYAVHCCTFLNCCTIKKIQNDIWGFHTYGIIINVAHPLSQSLASLLFFHFHLVPRLLLPIGPIGRARRTTRREQKPYRFSANLKKVRPKEKYCTLMATTKWSSQKTPIEGGGSPKSWARCQILSCLLFGKKGLEDPPKPPIYEKNTPCKTCFFRGLPIRASMSPL